MKIGDGQVGVMERAQPKLRKIRERIRRYERKLREEKRTYGDYRDGAGKRYLLGPSYLLLGDTEGAMKSFRWFEAEFPDDCGEPGHFLCWASASWRAGDQEGAARKLKQTMLANLYIIPHLLGLEIVALDIWHGSSDEEPRYLQFIPDEYFLLWDENELAWAARLYHSLEFETIRTRYVEIHKELKDTAPGAKRSRLVEEAYHLRR